MQISDKVPREDKVARGNVAGEMTLIEVSSDLLLNLMVLYKILVIVVKL
jgi:hypothetical protein